MAEGILPRAWGIVATDAQPVIWDELERPPELPLHGDRGARPGGLILPAALVTRYLTPEAYGQYSLALVVSSLVASGRARDRNVGLGCTSTPSRGRRAEASSWGARCSRRCCSPSSMAGCWRCSWSPAQRGPHRVMLVAGVTQVLGMQFTYTTTLLRAEQRAVPFAVAEIASGLIRFGATVTGLLLGLHTAELLFAAIALGFLLANLYATPALWSRLLGRQLFDRRGTVELLARDRRRAVLALGLAGAPGRPPGPALLQRHRRGRHLQCRLRHRGAAVGEPGGVRLYGGLAGILNGWRDAGQAGARRAIAEAQRMYIWITVGPLSS